MEDNMKKDLLVNETLQPTNDYPPPYSSVTPDTGDHDASQQYPGQSWQGAPPAEIQQPGAQYPPATVMIPAQQNAQVDREMFQQEACYAHCVRIWWCRPIGWLAVAELEKARTLYLAGDYDGAEQAAKKANMWSTVGLVSGLLLVAAVAVAVYFIATSLY